MAQNRYVGENADWTKAFVADPHFYVRPDGTPFGVFGINEGIETIMPKLPQKRYHPDGDDIYEWRILFYSNSTERVIGDADFYAVMRILVTGGYILDDNGENVLIQALSLTELDALMRRAADADKK